MTDLETMKAMFARAGVVAKELPDMQTVGGVATTALEALAGDGPRNIGYAYFCAVLYFAIDDGRLVAIGAWE